jgi:hypothetical protein
MNIKLIAKDKYAILATIVFVLLCIVTYASTSLTISFFGSIGSGTVKTSNLLLGLANDICKIIFPFIVALLIRKHKALSAALILITVATMTVSYFASQGIDLNVNNSTKQDTILSSTTYKQSIESQASKSNEISENRRIIKKGIEERKKAFDERMALSKTEITTLRKEKENINIPGSWNREQARKEKQKLIDKKIEDMNIYESQHNRAIAKMNEQLLALRTDTSAAGIIDTDNVELLDTQGYNALASSMGVAVDSIVKFKNIFIEVLAIALSIVLSVLLSLIKTKSNVIVNNPIKEKVKAHTETNLVEFKPVRTETHNINKDNLTLYKSDMLDNVIETEKGKRVLGYKKIRDIANMREGEAKSCYEYLKAKKEIETIGNASYLIQRRV